MSLEDQWLKLSAVKLSHPQILLLKRLKAAKYGEPRPLSIRHEVDEYPYMLLPAANELKIAPALERRGLITLAYRSGDHHVVPVARITPAGEAALAQAVAQEKSASDKKR